MTCYIFGDQLIKKNTPPACRFTCRRHAGRPNPSQEGNRNYSLFTNHCI